MVKTWFPRIISQRVLADAYTHNITRVLAVVYTHAITRYLAITFT